MLAAERLERFAEKAAACAATNDNINHDAVTRDPTNLWMTQLEHP